MSAPKKKTKVKPKGKKAPPRKKAVTKAPKPKAVKAVAKKEKPKSAPPKPKVEKKAGRRRKPLPSRA